MSRTAPCGIVFTILLSLLFASPSWAAAYRVGIAPSLPEPVETLADIELEPEAPESKLRLGLKVKGTRKEAEQPVEPLTNPDLPDKYEAWNQALDLLNKQTGIEFTLVKAKSQLSFELGLAKGIYDLAYITPLQFVAFQDHPGYKAVVKRKTQPLRGMIFVKKSGPYRSLTELRGATLAFPNPLDFAGSVAIRSSLSRLQFEFEPKFLSNQSHVYTAIARGDFVAGGGTHETFSAQPPEIRNALHIIWDSPGYSPYPFVAHPRVPFYTIIRIQQALVNLVKNPDNKTLLKHLFVDNGFEVARDSDWYEVEQIDLQKINGDDTRISAPEPGIGE